MKAELFPTLYISLEEIIEQSRSERRLWAMYLLNALKDLSHPSEFHGDKEELRKETLNWIHDKDDSFGSFLWTCDLLGLNETAVLEKIKEGRFEKRIILP